ncbi:hypothetical protein, partial [Nonomuraea basaltis]|uniref:hypothetical protein n=1 Tax=Nonomuraea basaltis TaxID=2495887 RepID=UPI00197F981F
MTRALSDSEGRAEQQPPAGAAPLAGRSARGGTWHALRVANVMRIERVGRTGRMVRDLLVYAGAV